MEVRRAILTQAQAHQNQRSPSRTRSHHRKSLLSQKQNLSSTNLPDTDPLPSDREGFIFYSDEGGYRATDEWDRDLLPDDDEDVVYYLGVIDICTVYNVFKRAEHIWKGLKADIVSLDATFLIGVADFCIA